LASTLYIVERIDPPDDFTVIFHLKEPFAGLLWNLADCAFGIVPYGSAAGFSQQPIGSGPFRFVSLQPDSEVILERNPAYWDAQRLPNIQRVRFAIVPDTTTRALELRKGSGDVALTALTPDMIWSMRGDHDPDRAQQLLDAAGFRPAGDGIRVHLLMKTSNTDETTRLLAAILQQQLRAVGIELDIRTMEFAAFYSDVTKGAFQLYSLRWIGGNQDPDIFEAVFATSSFPPRRANRVYYSNPQIDALVAQGHRELHQSKRVQIYAQIQQI